VTIQPRIAGQAATSFPLDTEFIGRMDRIAFERAGVVIAIAENITDADAVRLFLDVNDTGRGVSSDHLQKVRRMLPQEAHFASFLCRLFGVNFMNIRYEHEMEQNEADLRRLPGFNRWVLVLAFAGTGCLGLLPCVEASARGACAVLGLALWAGAFALLGTLLYRVSPSRRWQFTFCVSVLVAFGFGVRLFVRSVC
jgi:hypothetical protein